MKKHTINKIILLFAAVFVSSCELDRFPETEFSDTDFWNSETDLMNACNRFYQQLDGFYPLDNRADDNTNQNPDLISNGQRQIPATSGDNWNEPYDNIFVANNILEKGVKAQVADAVKNRYFAEARFFRAYNYFNLVKLYGGVPLLLKTLEITSPELTMGRNSRAEVMQAIYDDLDFAAEWLPTRAALPVIQYGRVTKSAALALKARAALYEGTRAKFHNDGDWQSHLTLAVQAASAVMQQGHVLYPSYAGQFKHESEGPSNTENIFVKIYGIDSSNPIVSHNYSRDLENGRIAPTRNLLRQYLYTDLLPAFSTTNMATPTRSTFFVPEATEPSYNTIFENRDPRMTMTVYLAGEQAYKGPWIPKTSLGSRTAYATKKGFNIEDWAINNSGTMDRTLIRYAEVLLIYAEAKFELNDAISDADLDLSINKLRDRINFGHLTNTLVSDNGLNMRDEIRRERTVELALEGFHYDDIIRWRTAEVVLPQAILGAKYTATDWVDTPPDNNTLILNEDDVLIVEAATSRSFDPLRDYLYPIPFNEIALSDNNVIQNPNWE